MTVKCSAPVVAAEQVQRRPPRRLAGVLAAVREGVILDTVLAGIGTQRCRPGSSRRGCTPG